MLSFQIIHVKTRHIDRTAYKSAYNLTINVDLYFTAFTSILDNEIQVQSDCYAHLS